MTLSFQENLHQWGRANLPWVLPDYVHDFSQALVANKAWITQGGPTPVVTVRAAIKGSLAHQSKGESEVAPSDEDLPMPHCLVLKVMRSDNIEHTLNKGAWAAMPAKCRGGQIFVEVHHFPKVP